MKVRGFEIVSAYQNEHIQLPQRKTLASAGYDISAATDVVLLPAVVTLIPTGIKAYMQDDEYLGVHIRSGLAVKKKVTLINGQGIIDADYYNNQDNEGHILVAMFNYNNEPVAIQKGERIAQGIFYKYLKIDLDEVNPISVRAGGLGSTGT